LEILLAQAQRALRETQYQKMNTALDRARRQLVELTETTKCPLTQTQKERLQQAYRQLNLAAVAQQQSVKDQLQHIREGKRALNVYANHT
jgi:hypothetical protein